MRHYQDLPPSKLLGARPKQAQASSTQIKKAQYKDHKMDLIAFPDDLSLTNSALFRWNKFPPGIKMGSSTSPDYYLNFVQMSASNERNMMGSSTLQRTDHVCNKTTFRHVCYSCFKLLQLQMFHKNSSCPLENYAELTRPGAIRK